MSELEMAVEKLRALRLGTEAAKRLSERALDTALATPEAKAELAARNAYLEAVQLTGQAEQRVRELAMAEYQATQNKAPCAGVTIKMFKRVNYDLEEATMWCRENAPGVLVLDKARFADVAAVLGAPVTVVQEPRAMIATKLE